jgi:hypothetical protein
VDVEGPAARVALVDLPLLAHLDPPGGSAAGQAGTAVVDYLADGFTDQSGRLTEALRRANERAWKAQEVALGGESLWERCKNAVARAEDWALRDQLRAFLSTTPLAKGIASPQVREVPSPAPPLFLTVAADDTPAAGRTIDLFTAYRRGKGPAELHVFQAGGHGFVNKGGGADHFMDRLGEWLAATQLLARPAGQPAAAGEEGAVGTWRLTYNPGDGRHEATLTVTKEESGLRGQFADGGGKFDVTRIEFKGGRLVFSTRTERDGEKATATFEGKVTGGAVEGEAGWEYQGMRAPSASRGSARPPGRARRRPGRSSPGVRVSDFEVGDLPVPHVRPAAPRGRPRGSAPCCRSPRPALAPGRVRP